MANWLCSPAAAEQELFVPFPFQVTYCSSRWFAVPGSFPAATIDFLFLLSELPRTRSPEPYWLEISAAMIGGSAVDCQADEAPRGNAAG